MPPHHRDIIHANHEAVNEILFLAIIINILRVSATMEIRKRDRGSPCVSPRLAWKKTFRNTIEENRKIGCRYTTINPSSPSKPKTFLSQGIVKVIPVNIVICLVKIHFIDDTFPLLNLTFISSTHSLALAILFRHSFDIHLFNIKERNNCYYGLLEAVIWRIKATLFHWYFVLEESLLN